MAVFAVGDVQGCYDELRTLLDRLGFDPARDRLWFTGDLVNRGPKSAQVLRFVKDLGDAATTVLGNHDLHLLAVAAGAGQQRPGKDTLDNVLQAPDRDELLHWLRHQPMLYRDLELGMTLVHAGLPPQWDLIQARERANELENILRGPHHIDYFQHMYGDQPDVWSPNLMGWDRLRFITNCFTRLRYCQSDGRLVLSEKSSPGQQRAGCMPWFAVEGRKSAGETIIVGHWSTLQLEDWVDPIHRIIPLDNGCVWGGRLTAAHLPEGRYVDHPCPCLRRPREPRVHKQQARG